MRSGFPCTGHPLKGSSSCRILDPVKSACRGSGPRCVSTFCCSYSICIASNLLLRKTSAMVLPQAAVSRYRGNTKTRNHRTRQRFRHTPLPLSARHNLHSKHVGDPFALPGGTLLGNWYTHTRAGRLDHVLDIRMIPEEVDDGQENLLFAVLLLPSDNGPDVSPALPRPGLALVGLQDLQPQSQQAYTARRGGTETKCTDVPVAPGFRRPSCTAQRR